jgi:hypothetical protein
MGKLDEFIEKRGGLIMTISLIVHSLLYIAFTVMYILNDDISAIENKIFIIVSLLIFIGYMIHFAYHSVEFINIDSEGLFH